MPVYINEIGIKLQKTTRLRNKQQPLILKCVQYTFLDLCTEPNFTTLGAIFANINFWAAFE